MGQTRPMLAESLTLRAPTDTIPVVTTAGDQSRGFAVFPHARVAALRLCVLLVWACFCRTPAPIHAQQATVQVPYGSASEGFFENIGSSWGLRGKNWFFSFGGSPLGAAPQVGGFDPAAGAGAGVAFRRGDVSGYFHGQWSQGWRQSYTTQAPVVTLWNGVPGGVFDASQSPFVIGLVPYVGGFPTLLSYGPVWPGTPQSAVGPAITRFRRLSDPRPPGTTGTVGSGSGLENGRTLGTIAESTPPGAWRAGQSPQREAELPSLSGPEQFVQSTNSPAPTPSSPTVFSASGTRGDGIAAGSGAIQTAHWPAGRSSAEQPAMSVDRARQAFAAEQQSRQAEIDALLHRAEQAKQAGKRNVARVYYEMAARKADGPLRRKILDRAEALQVARP